VLYLLLIRLLASALNGAFHAFLFNSCFAFCCTIAVLLQAQDAQGLLANSDRQVAG
jgi:hypothetical protein